MSSSLTRFNSYTEAMTVLSEVVLRHVASDHFRQQLEVNLSVGSVLGGVGAELYVRPLETNPEFPVALEEWEFFLVTTVHDHRVTLHFTLECPYSNNFIPRWLPEIFVSEIRWGCTCPMRSQVCQHARVLAAIATRLARERRLPFLGITGSAHPLAAPQELDAAMLAKLEVPAGGSVYAETVARGDRLGLVVTRSQADAAQAGVSAVWLGEASGKAKQPRLTPVLNSDLQRWSERPTPAGERVWLDHVLRVTGSLAKTGAEAIAAAESLMGLALAGRLVDPAGAAIALEGASIAPFCSWRPIAPDRQKLAVSLPPDGVWVSRERGLWLSSDQRLLEFIEPAALIGQLVQLPPLANDALPAAQAAWAAHPVLASLPAPTEIESLPVVDAVSTWQLVLDVATAADEDPTVAGLREARMTLEPYYRGQPRPFGDAPPGWTKEDGKWVRYTEDRDTFERIVIALTQQGLRHARTNELVEANYYWHGSEVERLLRAQVLMAWAGHEGAVIHRQIPEPPTVLPLSKIHDFTWEVSLSPERGEPDCFRIDITTRCGDHTASGPALLRGPIRVKVDGDSPGSPVRFPKDPRQAVPHLRPVAPHVWARVDERQWAPFERATSAVLEVAQRRGDHLVLSRGALMALAFDDIRLPGAASAIQQQALVAGKQLLDAKENHPDVHVPGLAEPLKPVQTGAARWLKALRAHQFGGLFADDRGFGKTVETLAAIAEYKTPKKRGQARTPPVLIAMEVKELTHWVRHCARFVPTLKVAVYHGTKRIRDPQLLSTHDIVLTTYDILRRDRDFLKSLAPELLFLDEATALSDTATERRKAVEIFRGTSLIIPITGTPIGRNLVALWSLMELAVPGLLGSRRQFLARAAALGPKGLETEDGPAEAKAFVARLAVHLAPFMLRRRKEDYPDAFPEKRPLLQVLTLGTEEAAHYEQTRQRAITRIQAELDGKPWHQARFAIERQLDVLRQTCSAPHGKGAKAMTTKGQFLVDLVQELRAGDHRVLIFSHFNTLVSAYDEVFSRAGIPHSVYMGTPRVRDRELGLFKDGHVDVMLLAEIGKSGLDIPEADTVIILDPWIDQSVMDQMSDRAHRISSTHKHVTYYQLAIGDTVEEHAIAILGRYQATADAILDGKEGAVTEIKFTREDVDAMLTMTPAGAD